jgi:hypothetical protein
MDGESTRGAMWLKGKDRRQAMAAMQKANEQRGKNGSLARQEQHSPFL